MRKFQLKINGQTRTLDGPEDLPVLWALRDGLELKGTKFGCGVAQCGACTVLVDGVARRSCITPISSGGEAAITEASPHGLDARQQRPSRLAPRLAERAQVGTE